MAREKFETGLDVKRFNGALVNHPLPVWANTGRYHTQRRPTMDDQEEDPGCRVATDDDERLDNWSRGRL